LGFTTNDPRPFDITPDGTHFVGFSTDPSQSPTAVAPTPQIQVVFNWFEDLKQRVPVP
jgi:hypothetical protein